MTYTSLVIIILDSCCEVLQYQIYKEATKYYGQFVDQVKALNTKGGKKDNLEDYDLIKQWRNCNMVLMREEFGSLLGNIRLLSAAMGAKKLLMKIEIMTLFYIFKLERETKKKNKEWNFAANIGVATMTVLWKIIGSVEKYAYAVIGVIRIITNSIKNIHHICGRNIHNVQLAVKGKCRRLRCRLIRPKLKITEVEQK